MKKKLRNKDLVLKMSQKLPELHVHLLIVTNIGGQV